MRTLPYFPVKPIKTIGDLLHIIWLCLFTFVLVFISPRYFYQLIATTITLKGIEKEYPALYEKLIDVDKSKTQKGM